MDDTMTRLLAGEALTPMDAAVFGAEFVRAREFYLGEQPLNKAEAHRLAHKLRDPKFYTARTKRAVNSGGAR